MRCSSWGHPRRWTARARFGPMTGSWPGGFGARRRSESDEDERSMRAWMGAAAFAASLATPALAHADPIRILLAVSHSRGAPGELPLLHAAADVEHVQRVLTDLGDFPSADVITLVDPTLASL